ncbi:MAG: TetR/AcrR family transcriptional regulator [Saprospiraceae bacterium]|nr:TetR/AcrR family transcriptional regulator [Saprospiraceae bacterium]
MGTKAERTKHQIIAEAATLFNQKGYSGTSLTDILDATGLSKGGLYGHFKGGKDELAIASFQYAVALTYELIGKRTHEICNTLDKLKSVVAFYREHLFDPPIEGGCVIQNFSVEADDLYPELYAEVKSVVLDWENRICYTIQKGIERGEIRADVDAAAFAIYFIGAIEGGILLSRIKGSTKPYDLIVEPLLERLEGMRPIEN